MKVVILAGGFGTRLSETTHLIPKPMVEIGGKPILWHIMKIYSSYGFNEFIDDLIVVDPFRVVEEKRKYLEKIKPIVYVGDTELDYFSATGSGVRFIALTRGQRSRTFLNTVGDMQAQDNLKFLNNINYLCLLLKDRQIKI